MNLIRIRAVPVLSLISKWSSPCLVRNLSAEKVSYVSITIDPEFKEIAVVRMQKKPVNTVCVKLLTEFIEAFKDLNNDKTVRAAIITSAFPGVFSAGLDLMSIYKKRDEEELYKFWFALQSLWIELYGSRLTTVAAINGQSPGAGCFLALASDYRIMAEGKYVIGLNGTTVGAMPPVWLMKEMGHVIGRRGAAKAIQLGTLFQASEALDIGLVDELVPIDQVLETARKQLKRWLQQPDHTRALAKQLLRKRDLDDMIDEREEEARFAASTLHSSMMQTSMDKYIHTLKDR